MTDRYLPDKAIDIIDEACSSKSMKYNVDEDSILKLKLEIEKTQKKIESYIISQEYHKATIEKEKQKELESKTNTQINSTGCVFLKFLKLIFVSLSRGVSSFLGLFRQQISVCFLRISFEEN